MMVWRHFSCEQSGKMAAWIYELVALSSITYSQSEYICVELGMAKFAKLQGCVKLQYPTAKQPRMSQWRSRASQRRNDLNLSRSFMSVLVLTVGIPYAVSISSSMIIGMSDMFF